MGLTEKEQSVVWKLGAILRLADALDRSHDSRVSDISCTMEGQKINIELWSAFPCDKEILAVEQKCELFEQEFKYKLSVSVRPTAKQV